MNDMALTALMIALGARWDELDPVGEKARQYHYDRLSRQETVQIVNSLIQTHRAERTLSEYSGDIQHFIHTVSAVTTSQPD